MGLEDGEVCLAKCLQLALSDGVCSISGERIGAQTGNPIGFETFEEFWNAYKKQVEFATDCTVDMANASQRAAALYAPNPYRSNLIEGCIEKGLDLKNRGPIYGHGQILAEGLADAVDSIAAVKHFIYDTKKYTMRELIDALTNDFVGYEELHFDFSQLSSKYPAYKNGENPNIFNPKFATGCLMDLGIYCIYPALDLFGAPKNIISTARFLESGADSGGTTVFEYDSMLLTMTWSKVSQDFCGSQILGDEGTVTIGSISQLNHISFCRKGSEPMEVIGETEKHVIMSHEAQAFYDFITKPEEASHMALAVSAVMEQIRKQTGIMFDI